MIDSEPLRFVGLSLGIISKLNVSSEKFHRTPSALSDDFISSKSRLLTDCALSDSGSGLSSLLEFDNTL